MEITKQSGNSRITFYVDAFGISDLELELESIIEYKDYKLDEVVKSTFVLSNIELCAFSNPDYDSSDEDLGNLAYYGINVVYSPEFRGVFEDKVFDFFVTNPTFSFDSSKLIYLYETLEEAQSHFNSIPSLDVKAEIHKKFNI